MLLHGRGEAQKSPERGARGFIDDYGLEAAWSFLAAEPSARRAPAELPRTYQQSVEAELEQAPFAGMVVVMPYLPDRFRGPEAFANAPEYARVLGQMVARAKADLPVRQERAGWALDGISLGGRVAMACIVELSAEFGAFGSVQAAIDERELMLFADLLIQARTRHPSLHFTLATSDQDYFRVVLEHYHAALAANKQPHDWVVLPGDHSYAFNRGPGVTHLLFHHDRWLSP
jgi:enterochelin esterase-like enzyme